MHIIDITLGAADRQGSGLTTGGFVSGVHGLPLKLISCTLSSLLMLVDLLTGWGSW